MGNVYMNREKIDIFFMSGGLEKKERRNEGEIVYLYGKFEITSSLFCERINFLAMLLFIIDDDGNENAVIFLTQGWEI